MRRDMQRIAFVLALASYSLAALADFVLGDGVLDIVLQLRVMGVGTFCMGLAIYLKMGERNDA